VPLAPIERWLCWHRRLLHSAGRDEPFRIFRDFPSLTRGELFAMTKIEIEMMRALAAYSGPVKRCRPGKARGADLPKKDDHARQWLNAHRRNAPIRDNKAERRKRRLARAERERIQQRNSVVRKRTGLIHHDEEP
jgi:hypothetical protein